MGVGMKTVNEDAPNILIPAQVQGNFTHTGKSYESGGRKITEDVYPKVAVQGAKTHLGTYFRNIAAWLNSAYYHIYFKIY